MATLMIVGKLFKASSMMVVLPLLAVGLFLVCFNPLIGFTNLNVNNSLSTTLNCSYATREVTVSLVYEMCLAVVVAMAALVYLVTVQERDNRELFFWTKILHVKRQNLLKQVDPFSPDQLQQWFQESLAIRKSNSITTELEDIGADLDDYDDLKASLRTTPTIAGTSLAQLRVSVKGARASEPSALSVAASVNAPGSAVRSPFGGGEPDLGVGSHLQLAGKSLRGGAGAGAAGGGGGGGDVAVAAAAGRPREYWDIPEESLDLVKVAAAGGAGIVWRATLNGKVVVAAKKILAMSDLMLQEDGIRELAGEVRILGRLNHVNILKFLGLCIKHPDAAESDQPASVFIVTEWCSQNLRNWIASAARLAQLPFDVDHDKLGHGGNNKGGEDMGAVDDAEDELLRQQVVLDRERYDIAFQVANGMKYLHSKHIIHRDLKPENVLITTDGRACICDFGLSVASNKGKQRSDETAQLSGTPGYIAPEIYLAASQAQRRRRQQQQQQQRARLDNLAKSQPRDALEGDVARQSPLSIGMGIGAGRLLSGRSSLTPNTEGSSAPSDDDHKEPTVPVTAQIDVFSFGILLWEIFASDGATFSVNSSRDLERQLETIDVDAVLRLLTLPDLKNVHPTCSHEVRKCMKACWALDAAARPTFQDISLTLRLTIQHYDCGEDFEIIHSGGGKGQGPGPDLSSMRRVSSTRSMRSILLRGADDDASVESFHERIDAGGGDDGYRASAVEIGFPTDDATKRRHGHSGHAVQSRRRSSTVSTSNTDRRPSSAFALHPTAASATGPMRAYANCLYMSMRCWSPRKLHFASLAQEYAFLRDTLTSDTYFRSLKFALGLVLFFHAVRFIYIAITVSSVARETNQTFSPDAFLDLYVVNFASIEWMIVAAVCACATGCQKYWALWIRVSVIVAEIGLFVVMPLTILPEVIAHPFANDSGSGTSNQDEGNGNVGKVYPALDSTFLHGYVSPVPDFFCAGTDWSPFLSSRQVSFCQALNFQFSYGTITFTRYVRGGVGTERGRNGGAGALVGWWVGEQHSLPVRLKRNVPA